MRVLLVTDQKLHIEGERVIGTPNFTNILKRLIALGELHVCAVECKDTSKSIHVFNDDVSEYVKKENITFIHKSYIFPSAGTLKKMKEAIARVDLVVGYIPALNAEICNILAHRVKKKFLSIMVACPWDGLWNQDWKRKIAAPYRFIINKYVLKHSDYALYVTHQFLQRRYPSAGKSVGISNVVLKDNLIEVLDDRIQHINSFKENSTIKIATTAMLNVKYKGQRFVLKALHKLKALGYGNYEYYMIGGGDGSKLKTLAAKLGIEHQVHFTGKITHEEVFHLLDEMDIYVHPSLQEGLPRSVVEAMSRALPCIGAKTAAIPELLDPRFVTKRKSVDEIVNCLLILRDKSIMKEQAQRNYYEAKKYECETLDKRRLKFYNSIRKDFDKNQRAISN